jgi:DNA-binding beta-propeller fold protein YncE
MEAVARFATGKGRHEMAFSDDNRFAFVTNHDPATVSVIDVRRLTKKREILLETNPVSLAFSKLAQAFYISSVGGTVTAINSPKHEVIARLKTEPGLGQIKFAPGDRFGFVLNTVANRVYILDAALNRIVQRADSYQGPDQLTFSSKLAYERHGHRFSRRAEPAG